MRYFFRLLFFLGCYLLILTSGLGQSLTAKSFGTPPQTDILISKDNYTINRLPIVDVHQNSGITVYTHTEADSESSLSGNLNIFCSVYDKDMNVLIPSFRVNNTNSLGDQLYPVVKINQNENTFVIAWASNHSTDGLYHIFIKKMNIYMTNSADVANQPDILVSSLNGRRQIMPKVAIDYNWDEVVVGWRDVDGAGTDANDAYARRLNYSDLSLVGNEFILNQRVADHQIILDLEISPVTGALYALYHTLYSTTAYDTYYRKFTRDASGVFVGANEVIANTHTPSNQWNGSFVINETTGDYCINWHSDVQDGSGQGVYFKVYNKNDAVINIETRASIPTSGNQLNIRTIWDESSGYLVHFYLYQANSAVITKFQIFDDQFSEISLEQDAIGGTNQNHHLTLNCLAYDQKRKSIFLFYNVSASYGSNPSKAKVRVLDFDNPGYEPAICSTETSSNWTHETLYNEYGDVIGETRVYFDKFGKEVQVQSKNLDQNNILAAEKIYDRLGRPVINTLSAPINSGCFGKVMFAKSTSTLPYTATNFDQPNTTGNSLGEINNPNPIASSLLGDYYSNSNSAEPFAPASGYPYSRIDFNDKVIGGVVRSASPGEALRMGSGHETKSLTLPLLNELDLHYLALKNTHFATSSATTLAFKGYKEVTVDENGIENISFIDQEGKLLAACKSGGAVATNITASIGPVVSYYNLTAPSGVNFTDIKITCFENIEIFNTSGVSLYSGAAISNTVKSLSAGASIQIRAGVDFTLSYFASNSTVIKRAVSNNYNGKGTLDIFVKTFSSVSISNPGTAQIKVIDLLTGNTLYTGSASAFTNTSLNTSSGFCRFQVQSVSYQADYSNANLTISYTFNYTDFAYNFYDDAGRLIASVAPNGVTSATAYPTFTNKYTYSSLNAQLSSEDPDRGKTEYLYRSDGSLKFSQNAKQRVTGKFSYVNYDKIGRVIEGGEYGGTLQFENHTTYNGTNPNSVHTILESTLSDGGLGTGRSDKAISFYDVADGVTPLSRIQRFISNRLSKATKVDASQVVTSNTWFSYDEMGRLEWTIQDIPGIGYKTIDYKYDLNGSLLLHTYQKDVINEKVQHLYSYDKNQRLSKVKVKVGSKPYTNEATYFYYLHGPLKRVELADSMQGIDYVYTINGWLKSINHPELISSKDPGADGASGSLFAKDVFGMIMDYYPNDYARTSFSFGVNNDAGDKFNGIIKAATWQTQDQSISGNPCQYKYTYDNKYQLTNAVFGSRNLTTNSFTSDAAGQYATNVSYDKNGNITYKSANRGTGHSADSWNYKYGKLSTPEYTTPTTNKLYYIPASNGIRDYDYDAIGQLTLEKIGTVEKRITYDAYNNVTQIKDQANHLKVKFEYNANGHRTKKITYAALSSVAYTTYYVRDESGTILSVYDTRTNILEQSEIPIHAASTIGTIYKNGTNLTYTYDISDHLGNVRATIIRTKDVNGRAVVESWQDYLPFGEVMPGRSNHVRGRNDYQGQFSEKDEETGYNAFELRMYDSRVGRWLSADPYDQYFSPYIGMGNDPINGVDPDGGFRFKAEAFLYNLTHGGGGTVVRGGKGWDVNYYHGEKNIYDPERGYVDELHLSAVSNWNQTPPDFNPSKTFSHGWLDGVATSVPSEQQKNMYMGADMTAKISSNAISFFMGGYAGSAFAGTLSRAPYVGRVFWSGGNVAKTAAANFAKSNGMITLEMTTGGKVLDAVTPYLPNALSNPLWRHMSANFAKGAAEKVHFFTTAAGPRAQSVWLTVEKVILDKKNIEITTTVIK